MKKYLVILFVLVMILTSLFALASCNDKDKSNYELYKDNEDYQAILSALDDHIKKMDNYSYESDFTRTTEYNDGTKDTTVFDRNVTNVTGEKVHYISRSKEGVDEYYYYPQNNKYVLSVKNDQAGEYKTAISKNFEDNWGRCFIMINKDIKDYYSWEYDADKKIMYRNDNYKLHSMEVYSEIKLVDNKLTYKILISINSPNNIYNPYPDKKATKQSTVTMDTNFKYDGVSEVVIPKDMLDAPLNK